MEILPTKRDLTVDDLQCSVADVRRWMKKYAANTDVHNTL